LIDTLERDCPAPRLLLMIIIARS